MKMFLLIIIIKYFPLQNYFRNNISDIGTKYLGLGLSKLIKLNKLEL